MSVRWFVAALWLLCAGGAVAEQAPRVVVSIKPVHSLVAGLMQGVGEPVLLVKGDTTPFDYRLDESARTALQDADLIVWVGRELEGFLSAPLEAVTDKTEVLELLAIERLKILPQRSNPDLRDPFFWLDTRNALMLLDLLASTLADLDPPRAHIYLNNRKQLFSVLAEIDRTFEYGYRGVSGRPVLLYHDTQQYFEQAYAMRAIGFLTARVGDEAEAIRLLQARQALSDAHGMTCLFTEAGLPSSNLELLGDGSQLRQVQLDSFGTRIDAGPSHYTQLLRRHFDAIKHCVVNP